MTDPVEVRRARIARAARLARRLGWACFGVAVVAFAIGAAREFNGPIVTVVVTALIVGSVLLAPAIVLGYAVKAAAREDHEHP